MMLPSVKNVNKGKRHKKKHYFKVGDGVVFKWIGERDYGYICELTNNKDGYATYTIRATGRMGCIYSDMELDDPDDPYCYISSILTKSITDSEVDKISQQKLRNIKPKTSVGGYGSTVIIDRRPKKVTKTPTKKVVESVNKSELKKAINKQKNFLNGNVDKSFW